MNRDERANTDGRIGPCRRTKTVPAGRRIGLARRRHAALRTEDARIDDAEGRNVLRFGPGIAPASVSLVNYPEGWSLLAYGDQGDALRIEAGVLGAGESRSAWAARTAKVAIPDGSAVSALNRSDDGDTKCKVQSTSIERSTKMYLLGLLIWIAVSGGLAWLMARLLTRRSGKPWLRPLLTLLLMPAVFLAPLADEIVGKFQYDRLCDEAREVKIYATHPVGEELYTKEGKWREGNTLEERNRLSAILESLLRWDSGPSTPEVIPGAIPIRRYHTKIYDRTDGRLLAEFVGYGTSGGWLGRSLGGPVLTNSACSPQLVERGGLKDQIISFEKSSGDTK